MRAEYRIGHAQDRPVIPPPCAASQIRRRRGQTPHAAISDPTEEIAEARCFARLASMEDHGRRQPRDRGAPYFARAVAEFTPERAAETRRLREAKLLGDRGDRLGHGRIAQNGVSLEQALALALALDVPGPRRPRSPTADTGWNGKYQLGGSTILESRRATEGADARLGAPARADRDRSGCGPG